MWRFSESSKRVFDSLLPCEENRNCNINIFHALKNSSQTVHFGSCHLAEEWIVEYKMHASATSKKKKIENNQTIIGKHIRNHAENEAIGNAFSSIKMKRFEMCFSHLKAIANNFCVCFFLLAHLANGQSNNNNNNKIAIYLVIDAQLESKIGDCN